MKKDVYTSEVRIPNHVLHSKEYACFLLRPEHGFYLYLCSYVVRADRAKAGPFNLHEKYYKNNLLASRWSIQDLAKHFEKNEKTIRRYIGFLVNNGYIKKDKLKVADKFYNVYVVGEIRNGKDVLYIEDITINKRIDNRIDKIKNMLV